MAIELEKIIVHKLNIKKERPILAEQCINLEDDNLKEVLPFFIRHISNSKDQGSMRKCQFKAIDDNVIRKQMTILFDNLSSDTFENIFINESRELAKQLSKKIKKSTSTSDGSLFVIKYKDNTKDMLGLLKMDPNDGVQVNKNLTITVQKDMLPSIKEKLHKSALIELKEYRINEFHLNVLDKQQNTNDPAKFFMDNFLNACELSSDRNITKYIQSEIYNSFDSIININKKPKLINELKRSFLEKEKFDVDVDLEPILRPVLKDSFKDLDLTDNLSDFKKSIRKRYPDAQFSFNPDVEAVKHAVYRTPDKNVELVFSPDLTLEEDYLIDHKTNGDVLITLKNGIGDELTLQPTRGR